MENKGQLDFGRATIFASSVIILVWAFLKSFNIIHSPAWVEAIPYFGVGFAILGMVYELGRIIKGVEHTENKVNKLIDMEKKLNKIEHEHDLAMNGKLHLRH